MREAPWRDAILASRETLELEKGWDNVLILTRLGLGDNSIAGNVELAPSAGHHQKVMVSGK